jgi:hypothetical protein
MDGATIVILLIIHPLIVVGEALNAIQETKLEGSPALERACQIPRGCRFLQPVASTCDLHLHSPQRYGRLPSVASNARKAGFGVSPGQCFCYCLCFFGPPPNRTSSPRLREIPPFPGNLCSAVAFG